MNMTTDNIAIELQNVSKTFTMKEAKNYTIFRALTNIFTYQETRKLEALNNINLVITKGEKFGIIGRNGSGKSTLLKIISGVYPPNKGSKVFTNGRSTKLALGTGFNMEFSARQNIYINGSLSGLSFKKIGEHFNDILEFSELTKFADTKLKYFSSGMLSRLSFAIAIYIKADIYLIDEFFGGVGDFSFEEKSRKLFESSFIDGKTVVYVSHNLDLIKQQCNRVMYMKRGECIVIGDPETVILQYLSDSD